MTLTARFDRFAARIRPTDDHIAEADRQTAYLIERLHDCVAADGTFTLEKLLRAGSNAKFTSLRRTEENIFDVDLGAYYTGEGLRTTDLNRLLDFTCARLRDVYPTKAHGDFEVLKSAVRIKFRGGIKLNVDVAPIIRDDALGIENGGWIPRPDGWRLTSVTCHNAFVQSRTALSNKRPGPVRFNRLVRMIKWWNNLQGELAQPSIFCDLITAAAFEGVGVTDEWQSSLRGVFTFLRRHQFRSPVVFSDTYDPRTITLPDEPVVVMDSVNPENNVTYAWTEDTRLAYIDRVQEAYDAMQEARSAELDGDEEAAIDLWCEVFGEAFRALSEDEEED